MVFFGTYNLFLFPEFNNLWVLCKGGTELAKKCNWKCALSNNVFENYVINLILIIQTIKSTSTFSLQLFNFSPKNRKLPQHQRFQNLSLCL